MKAFAFDANAIHAFQQERIADHYGNAQIAVERAFADGCIALDDEDKCLQEWLQAAEASFPFALSSWVADQLAMGTIRLFSMARMNVYRPLNSVGLPKDDHKWVKLAISCDGRIIVTNDIDFFGPTAKLANEQTKLKLKQNGGKCSKFLKKSYGIDVKCMIRFSNNLC